VGSLVFGMLPLLLIGRPTWGPFWNLEHWLFVGLWGVGYGLSFFISAAAPGALGGALIGMALYALAPRAHRLPAVGTLIGFLVGGVAVIPTLFLEQAFTGGLPNWELNWMLYLAAAGVAAASGGWVGRALARYEVRRRACLRDE
jgi:hypothetical protein